MTSKYESFKLEIESNIANIILSRPEQLNSMSRKFWVELPEILEEVNRNSEIRVLIISSTGKHFCAGMDLSAFDNGVANIPDVGTLQRLPRIIPDSKMRELAYTGRRMLADEAKESGLVSDVYNSQEEMVNAAKEMANEIAKKSPIAIYGLKALMNYSRDHTISDSLDFNALWSGAMLSQRDMEEAIKAFVEKREATFGKMADVKNFDEAGN